MFDKFNKSNNASRSLKKYYKAIDVCEITDSRFTHTFVNLLSF